MSDEMSIENKTEKVVFATTCIPYKGDSELHITLSTWCVPCLLLDNRRTPSVVIKNGDSMCEGCLGNANLGDESTV
jgi:hypothetical protein